MDEDLVLVESAPSMSVVSTRPEITQLYPSASETKIAREALQKDLDNGPKATVSGREWSRECSLPSDTSGSCVGTLPTRLNSDQPSDLEDESGFPKVRQNRQGAHESETEANPGPSCGNLIPKSPHGANDNPSGQYEPPPPPPPPPPPGGIPHFLNIHGAVPPLPPPPPPPPPGQLPIFPDSLFTPEREADTPAQFLPVQYSAESVFDLSSSRVIRIAPFRRNVFVTRHHAHVADYKEYEWLLKYGSTELWYEKPSKAHLRSIKTLEANRWAPDELLPLLNARPVSLETPKVWASAAMVTPTDDDVYECAAGHAIDDGYPAGSCHQCTDDKSEALHSTPLVYCLVLSTCQASDPFIHGAHFNGRQIYKLVKCGSREAAAAEAFYAAGVNGWNIAFSCVMKLGEDFEERFGKAKKVEKLWTLAEQEADEKIVRLFY